jgi:hypothetical protein
MNSLWVEQACEEGRIYTCAVAQLRLWFMRNRQGWQVASRHEAESAFVPLHEVEAAADLPEWHRFVIPSTSAVLRVVPVLPDRPVMSRPEARIEIAPLHKGLFFVTIPVWLRLEVAGQGAQPPMTLSEHPTRVLSKTWFGHPAETGEIGYALATRARQNLEALTDVEGRAICPVWVDNGTREPLVFAQLQLSVRHMGVYQTEDGKLWTNECRLGYTGSIFTAAITFGRTAPEQATGARLVSGPREVPASGLTARAIVGAIFRQPF